MYKLFLFLHLTSIAIWLGAMIVVGGIILILKRDFLSAGITETLKKIIRFFNVLTHPSAVVVLISGLIMTFDLESDEKRSFWLHYMQDFGSLIVLGSIIILTILGKRAVKSIDGLDKTAVAPKLSKYATGLLVSALLVISVLFVAVNKF